MISGAGDPTATFSIKEGAFISFDGILFSPVDNRMMCPAYTEANKAGNLIMSIMCGSAREVFDQNVA